jgi:predicted lactoylglutathione lyase
MTFDPRISMITLGVADVAASTAFYEKLGFHKSSASQESVTFLKLKGTALGLFGRAALAEDAGVDAEGSGFRAVTLAHNLSSEAEVDAAFAHALACGATAAKKPEKVFWGGYSGYFADPDGHLWELAYNPFMANDENGFMQLPD